MDFFWLDMPSFPAQAQLSGTQYKIDKPRTQVTPALPRLRSQLCSVLYEIAVSLVFL